MKAIAIIEVPEGGKGKWYIDGEIRYTENESLMKKFDIQMIRLRPLPQKKKPLFDPNHCEIEEEIKIIHEIDGYNRCIDEITGETNG